MYAVIRTGGKQYRVQPGDLLVVEKLDGEPGAEIKFDSVLMLGDDKGATVGAPLVKGAAVTATLVETRKGEKVKVFKKTRRKGYRRTGGHRQPESVLRVTAVSGDGKSAKWDGKVELISLAELNARARNLAVRGDAAPAPKGKAKSVAPAGVDAEDVVVEGSKKSAKVKATVVEHAGPAPEAAETKPAKKAAEPKKEAAKPEAKAKAEPKAKTEAPKAKAEAKPKTEAKPKAAAKAAPKAAAPAKKPAAAKPAAPKGKKK